MVKFGETNNITNDLVHGNDYKLPDVGEHLPPLNFVCLFIGSTGAGKSNACVSLLKQYEKYKAFDNLILISPTATPAKDTNYVPETKFASNLKITETYDRLTDTVLNKIKKDQNLRIDEYTTFIEDKKLYKRIMDDDTTVSDVEILKYYEKYGFKPPTCKYKHLPTLAIICDDITTDARMRILSDFASKSRHSCASLFVLCQSLVQMSPTLRIQASVIILFKTASINVIKTVYDECACSDMSIEEWIKIMSLPESKNNFIMINLKCTDKNRRYRLDYDKYIIPE